MHDFTYNSPTEIIFGKDTQLQTAQMIKKYGGSRVILVYGGGSIVRSGLLARIEGILKENDLPYVLFGGAKPNPVVDHVYEGIKAAQDFGADFVLAVGGGSAIDTAKGIAHGLANPDIDIWSFWMKEKKVEKTTPMGVVLTIFATGSESSNSAVLIHTGMEMKRGLTTDFNRPKFAILNPELTFSVPIYQIGCGITDIMMHTMDRYFNPLDNELTDSIAEALLRTVISKGRDAIKDPTNYEAMSELMWAGSLSHNDLTGLGGMHDFAPHQLGHQLSVEFDTAHGASISIIWSSWARYVYKQKVERFVRFANNVWGIEGDGEETALAGIQATDDYFKSIGMPICFGDEPGIQSEEMIQKLAYGCSYGRTRTVGCFMVLGEKEMYDIYTLANH